VANALRFEATIVSRYVLQTPDGSPKHRAEPVASVELTPHAATSEGQRHRGLASIAELGGWWGAPKLAAGAPPYRPSSHLGAGHLRGLSGPPFQTGFRSRGVSSAHVDPWQLHAAFRGHLSRPGFRQYRRRCSNANHDQGGLGSVLVVFGPSRWMFLGLSSRRNPWF
jgi:hypothetical protein